MSQSMKSLWASVQGDPVFMRRVNGWLTVFWLLMIRVHRHGLDQQRRLRRDVVTVGARLRALVSVASGSGRSQSSGGS